MRGFCGAAIMFSDATSTTCSFAVLVVDIILIEKKIGKACESRRTNRIAVKLPTVDISMSLDLFSQYLHAVFRN